MKFKDNRAINSQVDTWKETSGTEEKVPEYTEMISQTDNKADILQADIVNGCGRVLLALNSSPELKEYVKTEKADQVVKRLQEFRYTIGFAGGQSSGKSTVVNAMLQYPLMPTCKAATTCTPVELIYSEKIRITVADADTGTQIMDYPCDKATDNDFAKLKEYACAISSLPQVIENLQPFVDGFVGNYLNGIEPAQLDMQKENPKHVAVLMMMLLTVYVKQNLSELKPSQKALIKLREKTMAYFKIPSDVPNITVRIQWDSPILRSGLRILDLPGLGANAEDKKLADGTVLKGHDTITKEAIASTDTMVVVQNPEMLASVLETVKQMVSNLNVKEAVVENCIVPVLNMIDTCKGEAGKENAILEFQTMLQNVGITKEKNDIFPLSAIYGEYAYQECDDKSRTLFCSGAVQEARDDGADQDEIDEIIQSEAKKLQRKYNNSGVAALSEFFRTAFIERGKIEKSFSTITEIRALEKDIQSKINAKMELYKKFIGTNATLIDTAIPKLTQIANTPINKAIESISAGSIGDKISLMSGLTDRVVLNYRQAFEDAAEEYHERNRKIVDDMSLTWGGLGSFARVDSGNSENYKLYQRFQKESQRIKVDMKNVNMSYAKVLTTIKKDIEYIFNDAVSRLHSFADTYEPNLQVTIRQYEKEASAEVIQIFENVIPVISEFVEKQIDIAEYGIDSANRKIEQAQIDIANVIVDKNYEFISAVSEYAINNIQMKSSKFLFFDEHEKMKVDGENGAKSVLETVKESIGNNPDIEMIIQTVCAEQIINPMYEWYTVATDSIANAFVELQEKINKLLKDIAKQLKDNSGEAEDAMKEMETHLEQVEKIFRDLRNSVKDTVEKVLPEAKERNIMSEKNEKDMMAWISGGDSVGR